MTIVVLRLVCITAKLLMQSCMSGWVVVQQEGEGGGGGGGGGWGGGVLEGVSRCLVVMRWLLLRARACMYDVGV